jgi:cation diffusion facilitator family transporter
MEDDDVEEQHQHSSTTAPTTAGIKKQQKNVNLHAAYLHVLGDLLQSVAVLVAGIVIWIQPSWHLVDPVITLFFCAIVFYSTLSVIRSSVAILLEEVPPHISWQQVDHALSNDVPGICRVHDLHIWSISDGIPSLSMHCFLKPTTTTTTDAPLPDQQQALRDIHAVCKRFGIQHATIQIQSGNNGDNAECITCPIDEHHGHTCVTSSHQGIIM